MAIWFEEMKMPPLDQAVVMKAAAAKPMLSAELAGVAESEAEERAKDPEAGKFRWDGKFVANPALLGTWTSGCLVPTVEAFDPAKPVDVSRAPFKEITFKDGAQTNSNTMFWSGDTLLDLGRMEALKMTVKG